jgi:hypothetical protein
MTTGGVQTEDEVLSGAIDVFNKSVQTGTSPGGSAGTQQSPGILDNTASGTRQGSAGTTGTGNSSGQQGTGTTAGANTAGTGGTAGQGTSGTATSAGGGITNGTAGRRIVVIDGSPAVVTGQERVETLDRELDNSMGVFDGVILSRRQEAIARTNETGAGQTVVGNGGGDGSSGDSGSSAPPLLTAGSGAGDPNNNQTTGQLPTAQSDNRQGDYQNQGGGNPNIPADISDGTDDDIVARQLREAAMQEKDPVLREKLWDEYRKYKQGVQAKK